MVSVYIATPMYGGIVFPNWLDSILSLVKEAKRKDIPLVFDFISQESLITRGRNMMADRFYRSNCSHLLFVDADIGFEPSALFRLLEFDKPVTTCVYPKKGYDWARIKEKLKNPNDTIEPLGSVGLGYVINKSKEITSLKNGFQCVQDAGTGFMLIRRDAYTKVKENYPELYCKNDLHTPGVDQPDYTAVFECMIDPKDKRYLSEDYAFCRRAQSCFDNPIWSDMRSKLSHSGNISVDINIDEKVQTQN